MRILIGGIHQESDSFSPVSADLNDFKILRGPRILERKAFRGIFGRQALAGIIEILQSRGVELIPAVFADALPGGVVTSQAYGEIKKILLEDIRGGGVLDGICLALHGSMFVQGIGHAESDLLASLRTLVGRNVPIVAALDLHATITDVMISNSDGLVTYRTAPHVDIYEIGVRAAQLLFRIIERGTRPTMAFTKLPLLICGDQAQTSDEPMRSLIELVKQTEAKHSVLSASYALGQIWVDDYASGASSIVVTDGNLSLAQAEADRLAKALWEHRTEFRFGAETYPIDQAIDVALSAPEKTIFLSDLGDNPTAGAASDIPIVVERLLAKGAGNAVVAAINDPAAVRACIDAGIGETVTIQIGGKLDRKYSKPLPVTGKVHLLSDGQYYQEGQHKPEMLAEMGPIAVLQVQGVKVVLSSKRIAIIDPAQLRSLGIEPLEHKIVVLKIGYLFGPFKAIAPRIIFMLSPGSSYCDVTKLEYKKVKRPIYPLDPDTTWKR